MNFFISVCHTISLNAHVTEIRVQELIAEGCIDDRHVQ